MERELWKIISRIITQLDRRIRKNNRTHSVGRIVRIYLWAVLHDRPTYWACHRRNWVGVRRPTQLPNQSTVSRRLRQADTFAMLNQLMEHLEPHVQQSLLRYVDGKPLTVSRHSVDTQATFGYGAGGKNRGYKLHAIYTDNNRPIAWSVTGLNRNEHQEAALMIAPAVSPGYLLADANYDANHLYEHAGRHGVQLLTPRRYAKAKGVGHRRHSEYRLEALQRMQSPSDFTNELLHLRKRVETRFAHLTNFGGGLTCLPPWVRGINRVQLWVAGKIIVRLARDRKIKRYRA